MRYTGLELFMEKLKNMIYSNDNPLICNHPYILSHGPQIKHLYQELDSMIHTLFTDEDHELQQITDLKKRFKDVAQEAHNIIDLFVYTINQPPSFYLNRNIEVVNQVPYKVTLMRVITYLVDVFCSGSCLPIKQIWFKQETYQNLEDVMKSIKSIKEEFTMIRNNMRMDSSPRSSDIPVKPSSAAGSSRTKSTLRTKKASEDVVGFDYHAVEIRDTLVEDQKQLNVVSIVGMGGLGKTTLANKVFDDDCIKQYFHIRGWVTVSQTYEKRDLLIQVLESIDNKMENLRNQDYGELRNTLRQKLMGLRFLIVIDDVWSTDVWDDLKPSFHDNQQRSRILLTSRLKEVALHAKSHFIKQLEYLTQKESWELLRKKVFHGSNYCPKYLIKPGMEIAKNCHGLPLTLVVVAGVLTKESLSKDSWEKISQSVSSNVVNGQTEYIDQLALSFDHLHGHLRDCFLYLGGFPEDYKFRVRSLIWLWMAEGFIQEDGSVRSLEEIAEDYVIELANRNL